MDSPTQPVTALKNTEWKKIRPVKYKDYFKNVVKNGSLSPFDDSKFFIKFL